MHNKIVEINKYQTEINKMEKNCR